MDPEDVATEQARVSSDGLRENTARNGSISGGEEVSQPTIGGDTTEGLDNVLRSDVSPIWSLPALWDCIDEYPRSASRHC